MYTGMPFGPANTPPFYTAMMRRFQAEWMHLFQLCCNNCITAVFKKPSNVKMITPLLPKSNKPEEFKEGFYLPNFAIDEAFVLDSGDAPTSQPSCETYTASITVRRKTRNGDHTIVSGSRTIIDDVLAWSTSTSTL